jgi:ABC-type Mn2+/Zn2+ transport system permease subunit
LTSFLNEAAYLLVRVGAILTTLGKVKNVEAWRFVGDAVAHTLEGDALFGLTLRCGRNSFSSRGF